LDAFAFGDDGDLGLFAADAASDLVALFDLFHYSSSDYLLTTTLALPVLPLTSNARSVIEYSPGAGNGAFTVYVSSRLSEMPSSAYTACQGPPLTLNSARTR